MARFFNLPPDKDGVPQPPIANRVEPLVDGELVTVVDETSGVHTISPITEDQRDQLRHDAGADRFVGEKPFTVIYSPDLRGETSVTYNSRQIPIGLQTLVTARKRHIPLDLNG